MLYLVLKTLHVLGAVAFLGTGLGSAWYKLRAARSADARVVAWCDAEVVLADWVFTVPSGVLMPVTGLWMVHLLAIPWSTPWVAWGLGLFGLAGFFWLPAAWLQLRMRRLSALAAAAGTPVPTEWHRAQRAWSLLGIPSFLAAVFAVWVMVSKQVPRLLD